MSDPKGIRLWLRPARKGHKSVWIIRDGERQKSTGCGPREREEAERKLADYITTVYQPEKLGAGDTSKIKVADVILRYSQEVAPKFSRPKDISGRLNRLLDYFSTKKLSEINKRLCRSYVTHREAQRRVELAARAKKLRRPVTDKRGARQSARRELEDLRAAINHYFEEEAVPPVVNVWLPEKSIPRDKWMTESEAAKLLRTAWRRTQPMPKGGRRHVARHIARFILVGLYTGTRAAAICNAAIRPTVNRGYVDLEQGVYYRKPRGKAETNKRQPSIRLPDKLLGHLRRWARLGLCEHCVVEWEGQPVLRVSKAFRSVAEASGLPDVTPHVLRHTSISWALQRGAKGFDVSDFYGVSEKTLRAVYAHHSPDHQAEVTTRMDRKRRTA